MKILIDISSCQTTKENIIRDYEVLEILAHKNKSRTFSGFPLQNGSPSPSGKGTSKAKITPAIIS